MTTENDLRIECSNCEAPLAEVWVHNPEVNRNTKFKVYCPHCDDWSFQKEAKGEFYLGGTQYTSIESIEEENVVYSGTNIVSQEIKVMTAKVEAYG